MKENNKEIQRPEILQKGKYAFIDKLEIEENSGTSVPYIVAQAIVLTERNGIHHGDLVAAVKLSDLILKQSTYIDANGKNIEAHKLYTWPRNLGSTAEWTTAKADFLKEFVLYFPIEILSLQESGGVTWRYISPENFKNFPEGIQGTENFRQFADHQEDYFFLRRPIAETKLY